MKTYYISYAVKTFNKLGFGILIGFKYHEICIGNLMDFLDAAKVAALKNENEDGHVKILSWQEIKEL